MIMIKYLTFGLALSLFAMAQAQDEPPAPTCATQGWTLTPDFTGTGTTNFGMDTSNNQLKISSEQTDYRFLWVPCSNLGSVVKIDTNRPLADTETTKAIIGYYRTGPEGAGNLNPSRTAVDADGGVWVGNRGDIGGCGGPNGGSTVVRIGLAENNQCLDYMGHDGLINTWTRSAGADVNPSDPSTLNGPLAYGEDECLTHEFNAGEKLKCLRSVGVTKSHVWVGSYGYYNHWLAAFAPPPLPASVGGNPPQPGVTQTTFFQGTNTAPGDFTMYVQPEDWPLSGCSGLAGGYGAVIDDSGTLWGASIYDDLVMKLNTSTKTCLPDVGAPGDVYGIGIDKTGDAQTDGTVYASGYNDYTLFNTKTKEFVKLSGEFRGVAVDNSGTTWVASSNGNGVLWFMKNIWSWTSLPGTNTDITSTLSSSSFGFVPTGSWPTGVAIDSQGKVWVNNRDDDRAVRIDPATKLVDFVVRLPVGCKPYTYGDMSGAIRSGLPQSATWTTVYDSGSTTTDFTHWALSWDKAASGGVLHISVAVSNDNTESAWNSALFHEVTASGMTVGSLTGQYLMIKVSMQRVDDVTPVVYDLCLAQPMDCCGPDKKGHIGLCVKDCGNNYTAVLTAFNKLTSTSSPKDVQASVGGGHLCAGTAVCCIPKDYVTVMPATCMVNPEKTKSAPAAAAGGGGRKLYAV